MIDQKLNSVLTKYSKLVNKKLEEILPADLVTRMSQCAILVFQLEKNWAIFNLRR